MCPLLEPLFSVLGPEAAIYKLTGRVKQRVGNGSNTSAPRNIYLCADGKYAALSGSTQTMAKRIFEVIGRPEMIEDPRFRTNTDRVKNRPLVDEAVGAWFASRTSAEAVAHMREAGVTVGPVYNIDDAVIDPHFREREGHRRTRGRAARRRADAQHRATPVQDARRLAPPRPRVGRTHG
ncbi:MAG: CoA transferase [Acetobacteraceae bacterium]